VLVLESLMLVVSPLDSS